MSSFNKIFCIGMNKTGTTSLHIALGMLGLKSLSWAPDDELDLARRHEKARQIKRDITSNINLGVDALAGWDGFDAYSDIWPVTNNFEVLDRQYPGSLFIYTEREDAAWIESRKKHAEKNARAVAEGRYQSDFVEIDERKWLKEKRVHRERVDQWFAGREQDLLVLRLCDGEGFEGLAPFLGFDVPEFAFPRKNIADRGR